MESESKAPSPGKRRRELNTREQVLNLVNRVLGPVFCRRVRKPLKTNGRMRQACAKSAQAAEKT